jgi:ribonuclease HII
MSKQDLVEVEIIEDGDDDEFEYIIPVNKVNLNSNNTNEFVLVENIKKSRKPRVVNVLKTCYYEESNIYEIGVDEAGRGPLFGRVYAGAVVLSKNVELFNHSLMKDSKKFTSKKKIDEVAEYIKENAIAWAVAYEDEKVIDDINILQATQSAMHKAILEVKKQMHLKNIISNNDSNNDSNNSLFLLVDGNYFKPVTIMNTKTNKFESIKFTTVEGGDNKYTAIAAASILAKVERDNYIDELCKNNPELVTNYGIDTNKGYGAKKHIEGIKEHGISIWHRRTFGICKSFS